VIDEWSATRENVARRRRQERETEVRSGIGVLGRESGADDGFVAALRRTRRGGLLSDILSSPLEAGAREAQDRRRPGLNFGRVRDEQGVDESGLTAAGPDLSPAGVETQDSGWNG